MSHPLCGSKSFFPLPGTQSSHHRAPITSVVHDGSSMSVRWIKGTFPCTRWVCFLLFLRVCFIFWISCTSLILHSSGVSSFLFHLISQSWLFSDDGCHQKFILVSIRLMDFFPPSPFFLVELFYWFYLIHVPTDISVTIHRAFIVYCVCSFSCSVCMLRKFFHISQFPYYIIYVLH